MGYNETPKEYKIYVSGQREVEICHDVTFDEDDALQEVRNIPSSKEDKEDEEAGKLEEPKDDLRKRLLGVSNKKLLRLHRVATTLKDKYGSREKLVAGAAALETLVAEITPGLVAMVGLVAYRTGFARPKAVMGLQPERIGHTARDDAARVAGAHVAVDTVRNGSQSGDVFVVHQPGEDAGIAAPQ